ncbi:MAG: response regulator [Candidatus Auribacterota bacterium]|jgi:two-component system chemotaxis response regulator CheY|nr:response regulator [Candidatus Auribacterota bacterium]
MSIQLDKIRVLIVDDSEFVTRKLQDILEKANMDVVAVGRNGIDALRFFKEYNPDIITMDINMPDMDGLSALKLIHQINPEAKVIILSSMSSREKVIDAMREGAKGFITKPFVSEKVVAIITKTHYKG